jgi:chemotaxis protein CheX
MNANQINPFLMAVENVLAQFGVTGVTKAGLSVKEEMVITADVTAFIGVVGALRGNIAYSCSKDTAQKLASTLMMGMAVTELDEMGRSAVAELANLFTGNAASLLAEQNTLIDITPPSVLVGEEIFLVLSSAKTLVVQLSSPLGPLEVNICLEN